jgi:hypothetical protein
MAEIKKTVTTSQDQGVSETGAAVQQETKKVNTEVAGDSKSTATNAVWYLVGFVEILLGFRFVLKLFGANPTSGFVDFIYAITGLVTGPFDSIFGVTKPAAGDVKSVFEPSILVAAVVYLLVGWGIVKLFSLNQPTEPSA